METGLKNATVIVTGATANIGRAIALGFAAEGAYVLGVGRDADAGARLSEQAAQSEDGKITFFAADMTDPTSAQRVNEAATEIGPVDVLVNNVGGNVAGGFFAESDPETWQGDIDLNFGTVLRMTHAVLPQMIERKSGAIVNIGSTAGLVGDYMLPVYSAAKAAVHGFTKVLAKEVGPHGVRVNCVAPYGTMSTDPAAFSAGSRFKGDFFGKLFGDAAPEERAKMARKTVLERPMARPEEVASLAIWLASSNAGFVTGQVYSVDGGSLL